MQATLWLAMVMGDVILRDIGAGDAAWLVHQHATYYAQTEGFDDTFGALVAEILKEFERDRDPTCERAWIAERDGQRLGSIFCVHVDDETAKLRLFYLVSEARGLGLGKHLLSVCMAYARSKGYRRMVLWTHESQKAATHLYASAGWQMTEAQKVTSFGADVVHQTWEVAL